VPLGAAVGLVGQYGLIPLLYLPFERADHTLRRQLGQPAQRDTGAAHTSSSLVALVILLAVAAPVVEELFFRGLLLRGLLNRMPAPAAIAVSAVLFGLAHFEWVQLAGLAAFGVLLGILAWRTKRLAPSISAHMAFNAAAVATVVHIH
jgi:membrane protease YdiL (CAAX protease family)